MIRLQTSGSFSLFEQSDLAIGASFGRKYPQRTFQYASGPFALQHRSAHLNLTVLERLSKSECSGTVV